MRALALSRVEQRGQAGKPRAYPEDGVKAGGEQCVGTGRCILGLPKQESQGRMAVAQPRGGERCNSSTH